MGKWRTVGVRLKEEQVAALNQRIGQLGHVTFSERVGGVASGVINQEEWEQRIKKNLKA